MLLDRREFLKTCAATAANGALLKPCVTAFAYGNLAFVAISL